jgi:hypothetical protein
MAFNQAARSGEESTGTAPPLWNPGAAASWSLLLSPTFGSILHMKNWQTMGEPEKALQSKNWAIGTFAVFAVLIVASLFVPDGKAFDAISRAIGIGLLVGWYYSIGKSQQAAVLARYGKTYPRRGWLKPIIYAILVFLGIVLVVTVIETVFGAA